MRRIFLLVILFICFSNISNSQVLCSPNGNLVLYTNYDGGTLNIDIDVNIPNLKIGIVSYEAVVVNLSGAYVNNVTAIHYAGYNSQNNNNCGVPAIATTVINGAPAGVTPVIQVAPASPLANAYGYPFIICGYSCDTNVNQGGCNTIDQIQAYFMNQFPGSTLRFHKIEYNCWSGTQAISGAGTCCLSPAGPNLLLNVNITNVTCSGMCNGSATAIPSGGTPPYSIQWIGGPASPTYPNLCPGTYTVVAVDAAANSATQAVVIVSPPPIVTNIAQTACFSYLFNGNNITTSGLYKDTLMSANGCDSVVNLNLTINTVNNGINQAGNTLTAVATGAGYMWLNCGTNTIIPGAISQSYTPTVSGNYAVIVTLNGCTDTSICKNVVVTSIEQIDENTLINVYPNPVKSELFIEIDLKYAGKTCYLYDAVGKLVLTRPLNHTSNRIPVNELSKGLYFLQIEDVHRKWKVQK